MKRLVTSTVILIWFLITLSVQAQVTIAPTNLFISSQNKFGTYMVINGSDTPQEISVEFFFGYTITDDQGIRTNLTIEDGIDDEYSIAESIRAFPQNFILQPGQRQIVRLRVNAGNDLPDGTYWSRIKTTSSPESAPVEVSSDESVTARVGFNIEQITGLFYKKGTVTLGIEIENIETEIIESDGQEVLNVLSNFIRSGNSPFLGSITASLINQRGETVKESFVSTTLFFDGTQKNQLDISDVPSGEYTIRVTFESQRSDISRSDIVQMETATESKTVIIP